MKQIRDCINELKDEIVEFTSRMISIPTVNPPGKNYGEIVRLFSEKLSRMGIDWQEIHVPKERLGELAPKGEDLPRSSIVGHWGEGEKEVHLHGHYDVVPAASAEQFHPRVSNGRLYGRGAADMKGGLAVILFTLQTLMKCETKLNGTLSFSFTPDEETGGTAGLKYLLDEGHINRNIMGVLDPEPSGGDIINGSRGALSFDVVFKGRPSHVMLQHLGVNAFEKMIEVADAFKVLRQEIEGRRTAYRTKPPEANRSTLLLGGLSGGGTNFNIVPDRAFFTVDRRFNPEEKIEDVKKELEERLSFFRQEGIEIETHVFQEGSASYTNEDEPLCQILSQVVGSVKGRKPEFFLCPGLLETRFFVETGIPAVIFGPGLLEEAHGPNEFVSIDDIFDCIEIFALTALELLGR
ncbi:MAG: M20 family metallopeptidase [Gemmatimonadota bacterium]|nr:MAG: M20 family metallopeptidase [Gemmatimonadota bacterium]